MIPPFHRDRIEMKKENHEPLTIIEDLPSKDLIGITIESGTERNLLGLTKGKNMTTCRTMQS